MGLVDTAKDIYELVKRGATIDLQEKLIQLREEAIDLQAENLSLKEKIKELEELLAIPTNLKFIGRVYWVETADRGKDDPYCQKCYDDDQKLLRLQEFSFTEEGKKHPSYHCLKCKNIYARD